MAQPLNEYIVNGKQIFNLYGIGNPDAVPPVPLTPLITTVIDPTGFDTNGSVETWANTHSTIVNARALKLPPLSNPEILAVKKSVLVLNDETTPTASIGIQADNSGLIGTYYGMNLFNDNNTDFGITSTFPYSGSVVFDEEGGTNTTTTAIKQGLITITDPTAPLVTSFNATTLTSGAASATWADIISGSAGSNTLQEVLTAGNTATSLNIILNNGGSGSTLNQLVLSPNSSNVGAIENFTPVVPFNTAQSLISLGASSGNLTSSMDIFDNTTPISYQISGQIVQAGDRINTPYTVKPEVQLFTQYIDGMGTILKTAKYQVDGITQTGGGYTISGDNVININCPSTLSLNSNNLISNTDTLTVRSGGFGYTTNPNIIIENTLGAGSNTQGVPSVEYYKSGRNTVLNDVVMSQQFNAKAYTGVKTTFGKIECTVTGASAGTGIDGAMDFYSCINGVNQNVFRLNGADNENNTFRPLDLNGNALKTSQGDMTIDTTASTGPGLLTLNSKQSLLLNSGGGSGIQINTSGGNLAINTSTTGGIQLTGTALQSATSGGNSGQHLVITLNGTPYKIALQNP